MMVNGTETILRATLIAFLADTLAAHEIGGFKVGVGWSFRKCRDCLATKEDMQSKVSFFVRVYHLITDSISVARST